MKTGSSLDVTSKNREGKMAGLIDCLTCEKQMAALADKCPHCGAPNGWVHERIQRFIAAGDSIATTKRFNYTHTKTELTGFTGREDPLWVRLTCTAICLFGAVVSIFFGWMPVVLAIVLSCVLFWANQRPAATFHADFERGTWTSTDEAFWKPVRELLGL
jgi:hypothetical protein